MEEIKWKLDQKNTDDYLDICRRAVEDDAVFANFRRIEPMTMIVENSPKKSGLEYFDIIQKKFLWLNDYFGSFQSSDSIGNPVTFKFDLCEFSPTTLRYIKTLGDLHKFFGPLDGMRIAEIGGGYGGLCKIIHDVYKTKEYVIYDLPEAKALQGKFLNSFDFINVNLFHRHDKMAPPIDLLIAMYSWSELSHDLQNEYLINVISKAKSCYIMLNYDMEYSYQLLKDAFPNAEITDYNLFYDDNNTEYAPYNRFVIIKN